MCALALVWIAASVIAPSRARAAVARGVQSSVVTLELERDGTATVTHELVVATRGRLKTLRVPGVDLDATPLPGATIVPTDGARAIAEPEPLEAAIEGDTLSLGVATPRGLGGSTFHVRFAYRTSLAAQGRLTLEPGAARARLEWLGPRFDNGIDAVTLVVRAPAGALAPEVPAELAPGSADALGEPEAAPGYYANVISTLRRSERQDEIELVRPHSASGERVRWRLLLDASLFDFDVSTSAAASAPGAAGEAPPRAPRAAPPPSPWPALAGSLALGLAYALLVVLKARAFVAATTLARCRARSLLGLGLRASALLAGVCFAGAAALVLVWEAPSAAALLLVLASLLAAQRAPEAALVLRGPGDWRPLGKEALELGPAAPSPGAWLDASRAPGFVVLVAALGAVVYVASRLYEVSPYRGACALIASAALLPLFCTGKDSDLPLDPLRSARAFLGRLSARSSARPGLHVTALGRFTDGAAELDELRLLMQPAQCRHGFLALEVALEIDTALGRAGAEPVVLLRAADSSPCYRALPRELVWTRGRSADERVSIIRPHLPTFAATAALLDELIGWLEEPQRASERKQARRSAGSVLSTVKAGTRSSPAQAT